MATSKSKTTRATPRKGRSIGEEPVIIQVRFPRELVEAVDREAARLSEELGGEPVVRSEAIRIVVRRALMAKAK